MTSTPSFSSCTAMRSFSAVFMLAPGLCSPSLRVVSKMITRSVMVLSCSFSYHYVLLARSANLGGQPNLILDAGSWMIDTGHWMQNARYLILDIIFFEVFIEYPGSSIQYRSLVLSHLQR